VIVEFSDTGCGIRPDQIEHIFEPGFSGSGDTSGLGLAVCARIMKQHGGQICVSNRIHAALDSRSLSPYSNWKPVQHEQHLFASSNSSVLVVDDEPGMRTALEANFQRHGWRVETATGVGDATRVSQHTNFDLVVSDIRMQDGDGFEVMCSVLKNSPATAVILLTAFGSVPEAVESMRSGAFDYLTKPISFEQLQAAAARVMQRVSDKTASDNFPEKT
jgi:CheY-like chemotaxis protein